MVGINTNLGALNARQSLETNAVNQSNAMQQLSTGLRINSAKDDAAGLAIATKMGSNIRGVAVAIRNASDGISMAQTAESALGSVTNMLQRMRELAVQASNGTLTSANRASMQLEVKQLASEIDNIGKTANFNGIKLFDGSATNVSLQTNINAGDVVKMGVGLMNSSSIGLGGRSSLQSWGVDADSGTGASKVGGGITAGTMSAGLAAGDLTINGVIIGSSTAADDNVSVGAKESSAIAKVAAINRSSGLTGVVATVNQTVATGVGQTTTSTAGGNGFININGVTTASITLTGNQAQDRAVVVNAINAISGATGVTAVDTGNANTGIQMVAADGRNILATSYSGSEQFRMSDIGLNAGNGAGTAGQNLNIFTGTFTLQSTTNSPITIGTTVTGNINHAGLMAGTYAANTSYAIGTGRATWTTSAVSQAAGAGLSSGDLVINGVSIQGSLAADDTLSYGGSNGGNKDTSAIAIAAAINKSSSQTGVKAVAQANIITGKSYTNVSASDTVFLNGVSFTLTTTSSSKVADIVAQFNANSGATGVVASDNGQGMTLTAADGRNIEIGTSGAAFSAAGLGLTSSVNDVSNGRTFTLATSVTAGGALQVFTAGVTLVSDKTFTVAAGSGWASSTANALKNIAKLGFTEGTFGGSNNGSKVSSVDISTVAGANDALNAVDAALGQISDQRSNLGAIQNRLQSAVDNLTSSSTNLQAAQGRIQDTDYSATTTQMSKSQIIAQAATAMLAQANQQPQLVLSLLK